MIEFLTDPSWLTPVFWLLVIASVGIAILIWHRRPDQRDFSYLAQWSFRFVMGGFWWQQSLWKLPPLYTNHPEAPLTTGLTYLMPHCRRCPRSGLMRSDDRRGDFEYSREAIMATEWRIKAVHLGNCNCAYGCPCKFTALPTHGNCRSVVEIGRAHV